MENVCSIIIPFPVIHLDRHWNFVRYKNSL